MKNILVIGDLMIDEYLIGGTNRISPEAPVPIVNIHDEKLVLGGAGNVINNLLAFGINADILSVIGNCKNADILYKLLENKGINTDYLISEKNRVITKKTRILASTQQIVRYDKETTRAISDISADALFKIFKTNIKTYGVIILSDYGKGVLTHKLTVNIIALANKENVKVLVDPKGRDYTKYTGAYLLTPNKKEATHATNINLDKNLLEGLKKLKTTFNLSVSIITLSKNGIALFDDKLKIYPTTVKEVYDVTGAGDTVIAAIAYKLANLKSIGEAITFANLAASIVVGKIGAATASLDEINAKKSHIKTVTEINTIVKKAKQQHKKIVFTNGCFDILHLGHVTYLEKAKALGDILIVAINTDESVKSIKGHNRPINPEFDRAYILKSLKSVDYTVLFNESTPYELIKIIKPDILVKGADYKNKEVVGSDIAKNVIFIDFVEGKSTTLIINSIQK